MKTYITIILLLLGINVFAAKRAAGTIIKGQDTLAVTFLLPVKFFSGELLEYRIQKEIRYITPAGERSTLRPGEVDEFSFDYDDLSHRWLSRTMMDKGVRRERNYFLKMEVDGRLKLFSHFPTNNEAGVFDVSSGALILTGDQQKKVPVLQLRNGELRIVKAINFKEDMIELLEDCPKLTQRIEKGTFTQRDIKEIVCYFNIACR